MSTTRIHRGVLLGTTLLAGVTVSGAAWAQAASQPADAGAQVQELVVTGSHIARPNLEQPQPVTVLSQTVIQNAGPANIGDVIAQIPAVTSNGTVRANSNNFGGGIGAGVSAIDLRGLGTSRTLVLVDGQRHVAGDIYSDAVDVNSIPTPLVDHVEVLTGGASAVYGSDAVSGVVNIILKKKFEGFEFDGQGGAYTEGGFGAKYSSSFTAGKNFLDDRLNVVVTGFYNKQNAVWARDVPGANNYGTITNPNDLRPGGFDPSFYSSGAPITNDGIPDRLYVPHVGSELLGRNGVLLNANTFRPQYSFNSMGQMVPVPTRTGYNNFTFGQLPANCQDCYFPEDYTQETSHLQIMGTELRSNMDFTSHLHGFVDAKFVQTDTFNVIQPSYSFGDYQLAPDNAFISPELRSALAGTDAADYPFISKFTNDNRSDAIRRRTYRVVAGLSGDFDARFAQINWSGALNYGETDSRFVHNNLTISENFAAALDSVIDPATGLAACRINVPSAAQTGIGSGALNARSCVPYNPFGVNQLAGANAYAFGNFTTFDKLTQQDANLNVSFDTGRFFNLQGGPVAFAAGGEYRMERTKETNDPMLTSGATEYLTTNSGGGFNVYEGYVELNAPIFKHFVPGLDHLSFDTAYRGAHYSTVKGVSAYRFTVEYGPLSWVTFRGTYGRSVRAPNITEAFSPTSSGYYNITDPCSVENIQNNVNYARNCAAAGVPAGFVANTGGSIIGQSSGNPNLSPETSFSYTGGIVLTPPIMPHFSITLDYYAIKIKNAITDVAAQDIINNCYNNSGGLNSQYCGLLTRGADNNINSITTTYVNAAKEYTDGFELQADYHTDVAPLTSKWRYTEWLDGRLNFNLTADYVRHLRYYPFQSNPAQVNVLEGSITSTFGANPQLKGLATLTYNQGPVTVSWETRYVGKMALFNRDPTAADHSERLNNPFTPVEFYHDLNVRYRLSGEMAGTELFLGVNNLFNIHDPFTVIGTQNDTEFDLGRFMFAGIRIRH